MRESTQRFSASRARDAVYRSGLRSFMEIAHNELDRSGDLEMFEIYSPAVHPTVVVDRMPEAAATH